MAGLSDLLVSYKQLEVPKESANTPELPLDRYSRLQQYLDSKTEAENTPETTDTEAAPATTFKWYYNGNTTRPTQSSTSSSARVNNTPIIPKNDWVKQLSEAYRKYNVSENGIRNLIAKNALESNWGKSAQGRYNYGNITTGSSWKGNYVNGHDHDGKGNPIRNKFRSYNTMEEFAKDEIDFLKRLYDFDDSDDIDTFIHKLQGGNKGGRRYAEDPKYRNSIRSVYNGLG